MSSGHLPVALDVRKAVARNARVEGVLAPGALPRLGGLLASGEGSVAVACDFFRDEEGRSIVAVRVEARLRVTCQRCLEAMWTTVTASSLLAAVSGGEMARRLPGRLEPLLVEGGECDLRRVAEDEVILALPSVSRHDSRACRRLLDKYSRRAMAPAPGPDHPFKALERLRSGRKAREP